MLVPPTGPSAPRPIRAARPAHGSRRSGGSRNARRTSALLATLLALAACTPGHAETGSASAAPVPTATPSRSPELVALVTSARRDRVEPIAASDSPWASRTQAAPGISAEQVPEHDPARPVSLSYPVIPGFPGLSAALEADAQRHAADFRAGHTASPDTPPELNQSWALLAGSGGAVGVGLDTFTFAGANGAHEVRTWWVDSADAAPVTGAELVAPEQQGAVRDRVLAALVAHGHPEAVEPLTPDTAAQAPADAVLAATGFTQDGRLRVVLSPGLVLPYSSGMVAATVDGDPSPWLSPLGVRAREASAADAPPLPDPNAVPTPPPTAPASPPGPGAPAGRVDCTVATCLALTFDDGPGHGTAAVLDALDARGARATFFLVGQNVAAHADVVRRMSAEGHEVGNHTWDHRQLTRLSAAQQRAEVDEGGAAIEMALGARPALLRPPYGSWDAATTGLGLPIILWDVDTLDWKTKSTQATVDLVLNGAHRGAIVLMHDIHPTTVAAVPEIVNTLTDRGYSLVTVSELYDGDLAAGHRYSGRR